MSATSDRNSLFLASCSSPPALGAFHRICGIAAFKQYATERTAILDQARRA
jgi:hypothetical protein